MGFDELLEERGWAVEALRRIERWGPDCLSFAELAGALSPAAGEHIEGCDRCRTLRERLRKDAAGLGFEGGSAD